MSTQLHTCIGCGKTDDHPKDQVVLGPDHTSVFFHHDCHAAADPPCPSCTWLVAHKGTLTGQDWRDHIGAFHAQLTQDQMTLTPGQRDIVTTHVDGTVTHSGKVAL